MRTNRSALSIGLFTVLTASGCAGKGGSLGGSYTTADFPSAEEVYRLTQTPLDPNTDSSEAVTPVGEWTMSFGALRTTDAPGRLEGKVAGTRSSQSLDCMAQEVGAMIRAGHANPQRSVLDFVATRCGHVHGYAFSWSERASGALDSLLGALPANTGRIVGGWEGEHEGRKLGVLVTSRPLAALESVPVVVNGGRVEVTGTLEFDPGWVTALVTKGDDQFARCDQLDLSGRAFEFSCPVDPSDPRAYIEVTAASPGAFLGRVVALVQVSPDGSAPLVYSEHFERSGKPLKTPRDFVEAANAFRADRSLPPLRHYAEQSEVASSLAPLYYEASDGDSSTGGADEIALGLMAGWSTGADVRDAKFSGGTIPIDDTRAAIAYLLTRASGRRLLLDGRSSGMAVGFAQTDDVHAHTLLVSYATMPRDLDVDGAENEVLDELDRKRRSRGRGPVVRVEKNGPTYRSLDNAVNAVLTGTDFERALGDLVNDVASGTERESIRGWGTITSDPEYITFPTYALREGEVAIAVRVARYRPVGSPWWQYLVFMLAAPM